MSRAGDIYVSGFDCFVDLRTVFGVVECTGSALGIFSRSEGTRKTSGQFSAQSTIKYVCVKLCSLCSYKPVLLCSNNWTLSLYQMYSILQN